MAERLREPVVLTTYSTTTSAKQKQATSMRLILSSAILSALLLSADTASAFVPTSSTSSSASSTRRILPSSRSPRDTHILTTRLQKLEKLAQKEVTDKQVEELLRNYGEKSRTYRRDSYTSADWVVARRPDRFVENLLTITSSGLLRQISLEITVLAWLSAIVVFYNDIFVEGFVGLGGQHYGPFGPLPALQLPMVPFSLSTVALGLLLAFRTNVSYARWNEARTAWGSVINDSRSIVRMGCIWAKSYNHIDDASLQRLGEAVCSFSRALMNRTLPPQEDSDSFKRFTFLQIKDQSFGQILRDAKHRPTAALAEITQILVDFQLNPIHQVEVERVITGLCDALGTCERIYASPVPRFYTRHTARFLAVWLFTLPLGLYAPFATSWNHLAMIPVTVGIGLFFLGIEELATQMEEPFSILPMEKMCEGSIRAPVMEQVERSMFGQPEPITIVAVDRLTPPPPEYPVPPKVWSIEDFKPTTPPDVLAALGVKQQQQQQVEQQQQPQQVLPDYSFSPATAPEPVQVPSFSTDGFSEADKARLSMYLNPPPQQQPQQQPQPQQINGGHEYGDGGGMMTVEEMNRLWAGQSGSQN